MIKETRIIIILLILMCLLLISHNASAIDIDPFAYFNAYSLGDIGTSDDAYNTDIEGTTGAAGNTFFGRFGATNVAKNDYVLHTGGDVSLRSGRFNGSIDIGGNATMQNYYINGDAYAGGDAIIHDGNFSGQFNAKGSMNCYNSASCGRAEGGRKYQPMIDLEYVNQFFLNASADIGSMAVTREARPYYSTLNLDVISGVNVFNLNMTEIYATKRRIEINGPSDAIVYINALDEIANLGWSMFWDYNEVSPNNVILNFPFTTELDINGGHINILAPLADVDFTSGAIRGNLIAGNLYGGAQVNNGHFDYDTQPVPEPGTVFLLGSGLAGLFGLRRKLKR